MSTPEQVIEHALRDSLQRRAQSQGGIVALVEAGNPATVRGTFWLSDVARDVAAAMAAHQAATAPS